MAEALLFLEAYQVWIYLVLGLAALIYLRLSWRWFRSRRVTIFALEREQATERLTRSAILLGLALALMAATFIGTTVLGPAMPASERPTALPTVSLLATVTFVPLGTEEAAATATLLPVTQIDSAGCTNPLATIVSPATGESLSGAVEITGTANIEDFAFYKYEYISLTAGSVWRAIGAGTRPVRDDTLGLWDTTLVLPGEYALRLVVTDTAGNAPLPCMIPVRVLPPSE